MPKIRFSQKNIDNLSIPITGRMVYSDATTRFLSLIVTCSGSKTYYYIRKHQGKTIFDKIADSKEIPLREAQKEVACRTVAIDNGEPRADYKRTECPKLEYVVTEWLDAKRIRGDKERNGDVRE